MITHQQILNQYDSNSELMGYNLREIIQGDDLWDRTRLGVISASNAYKILKPTTQTYKTYLSELVCQVVTGKPSREPVTSRMFDHGHAGEAFCKQEYTFLNDVELREYPFIYKENSLREGFSPDGLFATKESGVEIKAPYTHKYHSDLITNDTIKPEYFYQCQFAMYILDCEYYHFISYDSDFEGIGKSIVEKIIYRDEKVMKTLEDASQEFIFNMDKMLKIYGIDFNYKWRNENE